jgi:hypothetical protein
MKHLVYLSPAEVQLLLYGRKATIRELLKGTFMDLVLKQALNLFEVERQPHRNEDIRIYKYVEAGRNFFMYKPLLHEFVFLDSFKKDNSLQILFRNMVRIGYQNSISISEYQHLLFHSPRLDNCFYQNLFQKIFWGFQHSHKGKQLRTEIQAEITALEKELATGNAEKLFEILKAINGNVVLLSNFRFDLLKEVDAELAQEINRRTNQIDPVDVFVFGDWDDFGDVSGSFDSSCSGASGCSGGDSGCGGCGGCGGD